MKTKNTTSMDIEIIRKLMERSSLFLILSGLGSISVGIFALLGVGYAHYLLQDFTANPYAVGILKSKLLWLGAGTFACALLSVVVFSFIRSKKLQIPFWSSVTRRLIINIAIPFIAGSFIVLRLLMVGSFSLIAPVSLIVYGIAIFCGSQYSTDESRYLAVAEMLLGGIAIWFLDYSLWFWATGFGIFHILFGLVLWFKYERKQGV
jgi:hypothetical protein